MGIRVSIKGRGGKGEDRGEGWLVDVEGKKRKRGFVNPKKNYNSLLFRLFYYSAPANYGQILHCPPEVEVAHFSSLT